MTQGPVITAIEADAGMPSIPFIGLVESTVVEAFRRSGLPMQRIRKALEVLAAQGELEHALASKQLYTDGAEILYDYAGRSGDKQMRLLTVVSSKQIVFHDVIEAYLERISFGDTWATELIVPVTEHPILRIRPNVFETELPGVDVGRLDARLSPAWVPFPTTVIPQLCAGTVDEHLDLDTLVEHDGWGPWTNHWEIAWLTDHPSESDW